jgi:hypothetical protein
VQLHRLCLRLAAGADVEQLDEHRKRHARVHLALRDLLAEALGDERHAVTSPEIMR